MNKLIDLTIIIVNYNTRKLLEACLDSIIKNPKQINTKIVVVDNASTDGSSEMITKKYPQIQLIQSENNVGFATGNNLALKEINSELALLLNSDTEILPNCLDNICDFAKQHEYGILSCKILNKDLTIQPNTGSLPFGLALFNWLTGLDGILTFLPTFHQQAVQLYREEKEVGWVSGTAMLIKRKVINKIGLLDESIFMYSEDVEYCLRAKRAGFKIGWIDQGQIIHLGGGSSSNPRLAQWQGEFKGLVYIYQKYYGAVAGGLVKIILNFFVLLRILFFAIMGKTSISRTYGKILFNI